MSRSARGREVAYLMAMAAFVLMGTACTSAPGFRPLSYAAPGEARVFASPDQCPHEPLVQAEAAPLVAAILTGAASQLLSNFGTALTEASKGGNLPSSVATLNMSLPPDGVPRCLLIIRGAFDSSAEHPTAVDLPSLFELPDDAKAELAERLKAFAMTDVYRVDHLVEIQLTASPNSKALSFAPLFVRIDRSLDESRDGTRSLSVGVKFQRVGATSEAGSVVVVPDRVIGKATPGMARNETTKRYPRESPWFGTFHATSAPAGGAGVAGLAGAAAPPPPPVVLTTVFSDAKDAVPVTVTTTVVETRPTREGLAFIASIFSAVKPKIEEALKPMLDSNFKAAEDVKEQAAKLTGDADHQATVTTAKLAVLTYCENSSADAAAAGKQDRLTKSSAARVAQLKANASSIKYDQPLIYDKYIEVTDQAVPKPCP